MNKSKSDNKHEDKIRTTKRKINDKIELARISATYSVLRTYCHEVDVDIENVFAQAPVMHAINYPYGGRNGGICNTCDCMVQYALNDKKVYCVNKNKTI